MNHLGRRDIILFLLLISSLSVGQIMTFGTAPAHEFGHYMTAKSFGWNITEVGWYSHVKYSEESIENASRLEKLIVSIAGMIFAPIIPYILIITRKRSMIRDIIAIPYLGFGIIVSTTDLKKVMWHLLTSAPMSTEYQILSPMNLVISTLTIVVMFVILNMLVKRYRQCLVDLSTTIDELS